MFICLAGPADLVWGAGGGGGNEGGEAGWHGGGGETLEGVGEWMADA